MSGASPPGPIAASVVHAEICAAIHALSFPAVESWSAVAFAELLRSPGVYGLIEPESGLVLIRRAADEAEILTLATPPHCRRRGIARRLLAGALGWAGAAGVIRVFLEVAERNDPARALYASLGFAPCGRRPGYYGHGGDALVLQLSLGG